MNKTTLLSLIILNTSVFAGEEDRTGSPTNSSAASEVFYKLVCTPVVISQDEIITHCLIVEENQEN